MNYSCTDCYAAKVLKPIHSLLKLKHINHKLSMGKFNILYLNINSIAHKLDELEIHIHNIINGSNKIIHCIALTEVRIHEYQTSFFNIPSYTSFFCTRNDGYGGCALFVHDSINAHLIDKQSIGNIEFLTVKLIELSSEIIVVYKQPAVSNEVFGDLFNKYISNKKFFIMLGDMNLNLLIDSHTVKQYIDCITSNGSVILNSVTEIFATRIANRSFNNRTTTSKTIIDHIVSDCIRFSFNLSYCDTPLSDHRELLLSVDNHKSADFVQTEKTISYFKLDYDNYNNDIDDFLTHRDINSFDLLIDGIKHCRDKNIRSITYTRKSNPQKPWITNELISLINQRRRYFLLRKKSPTNEYLIMKYNSICDLIKKKRNYSKYNFNSQTLNKNINKPKQMWRELNHIIFNKISQKKVVPVLNKSNGISTMDRTEIANTLNDYFKHVGKNLHDKILTPSITYMVGSEPQIASSMLLYETNKNEISYKIVQLKNSKSLKEYISASTCKNHIHCLSEHLSFLMNNHFRQGTFPDALKCSRIIPLYKDGNQLLASNYRPISILPVFSKIFESILCDRINSFLTRNKIIHPNQFGFQKNSGTLSATSTVIDMLQTNLDIKGNIACCVFVDLRKAFDTVPHNLLLNKIEKYGLRGNINNLLHSYLTNRNQYVDLNDNNSSTITNDNQFGVPQGSNLGPLLFLLFINGIFSLKLNGCLVLFADDATLIYFNTDINTINQKVQEDLDTIESWLSLNKLTLNAEKTKYMLLKMNSAIPPNHGFSLKICNKLLIPVSHFKYLGITIQDSLKWDIHIDNVCRRINGFASVVKRLGNKIHISTKISVYYSMVNSHLVYLSPIWGTSSTQSDLNRLQVAQNQSIRKIFNQEYQFEQLNTTQIMSKYDILNVQQLIEFNLLIMMHKINHGLIKTNFAINRNSNHQYETRASAIPRANAYRTNIGQKSVFRSLTDNYFKLNPDLRNIVSINRFKKLIKQKIVNTNSII